MKLSYERDIYGTIGDDTDIVNDGEYVAYAEASWGPYTIEFQRAHDATFIRNHKPRFRVRGPLVDEQWKNGIHTLRAEMDERDLTWDYVETAETEMYESE